MVWNGKFVQIRYKISSNGSRNICFIFEKTSIQKHRKILNLSAFPRISNNASYEIIFGTPMLQIFCPLKANTGFMQSAFAFELSDATYWDQLSCLSKICAQALGKKDIRIKEKELEHVVEIVFSYQIKTFFSSIKLTVKKEIVGIICAISALLDRYQKVAIFQW